MIPACMELFALDAALFRFLLFEEIEGQNAVHRYSGKSIIPGAFQPAFDHPTPCSVAFPTHPSVVRATSQWGHQLSHFYPFYVINLSAAKVDGNA